MKKKAEPLVLGLFRPSVLRKYELEQSEVLLLYWLFSSIRAGWMNQIDEYFFWCDHTYVAECIFTTTRKVQRGFSSLCAKGILERKLVQTKSGRRAHYAIIRESFLEMLDVERLDEKEVEKLEKILKPAKLISVAPVAAKKEIDPEIEKILVRLLAMRQHGKESPLIFTNRLPKEGGKYTKTLKQAAKKIKTIYDGTFLDQYVVGTDFRKRNEHYLTKEVYQKINASKGSWKKVEELLIKAAKNYRFWFWEQYEPETKEWLPRDISNWLFDRYSMSSVFMCCVFGRPDLVRELMADRIYASLPVKVRESAEKIYKEEWDSVAFWKKIKGVLSWYEENSQRLVKKDANYRYWFDGGASAWFVRYVQWLQEFDGLYFNQIGVGNATWAAWCASGAKKYGFKIE